MRSLLTTGAIGSVIIAPMLNRRGRAGGTAPGRAVLAASLGVWWVLVLAKPAEAYIDPSAGGMLVQLLLAGTAGVAVLGKLMWSRIKRVFGFSDERSRTDGDPSGPHDRV